MELWIDREQTGEEIKVDNKREREVYVNSADHTSNHEMTRWMAW